MNKQKFIELVENPSSISEKDAGILAELARNYPYSPLVHTMLAKAQQSKEEAKSALATAALYIPDRSVLKAVMEDQIRNHVVSDVPPIREERVAVATESIAAKKEEQGPNFSAEAETVKVKEPSTDVFEELQENLRKLKEQRNHFENQEEKKDPVQNSEDNNADAPSTHRFGSLPEALQELIENKEEQEINDPKRVEQINLIDNFIKNSSSISRKYRSINEDAGEQNDLTSTYSFTPPDLATENLAQIMVRQGKTEKAIDIYEKLILKYPQKKAYFATCIEKLKTT